MDKKTCFLGKIFSERPNAVNSEAEIYAKGNEEEKLPYRKQVALEETVKNLHEQVACLLFECNAKDRLMAEHEKTAQEANSGRERAEALVAIQKQELENVIQQKVAAVERLIHLNAALKNCRQELSSTKIEQDQKMILEMAHKLLQSNYIEAKKKLANLTVENARLTKALVKKEEIIEDVNNQISKATAKFNALVSRLDSTERGNNVLKNEYGFLKKELTIKSRHAFMANRQQLETERQNLRLLVRKRAPGHPKTNPKNHSNKALDRRMSLLIKQLSEVEEENRILKESACKREDEIQILKAELARVRRDEQNNGDLVNQMNDHFENLRLTNFDLDQQLFAAKAQLQQALHKISFLEMELEDKSHDFTGLEATCLELQLQLTSVSSKDVVTEDLVQEETPLQTGIKITAGLTDNKLTHHCPLHDLMAAEDGVEWEVVLSPPMIKQIINATEPAERHIVIPRVLPIVPIKKRCKRTELLRRLLFRAQRGGNKKKLFGFAAYKL
ncbi:hypothetical protein L1987_70812 [Smallanthus sonchifolius]|uniref:Uncharacterized protein n=1 Tax=Smallanthus sonchifolius TaxID=185202 RepID=A0ACB9ARB1_9ASTR|nr:hypothetical protein L1987_70812 [Smallanthus sonchifolius]